MTDMYTELYTDFFPCTIDCILLHVQCVYSIQPLLCTNDWIHTMMHVQCSGELDGNFDVEPIGGAHELDVR
jgi:hypothetical protein